MLQCSLVAAVVRPRGCSSSRGCSNLASSPLSAQGAPSYLTWGRVDMGGSGGVVNVGVGVSGNSSNGRREPGTL